MWKVYEIALEKERKNIYHFYPQTASKKEFWLKKSQVLQRLHVKKYITKKSQCSVLMAQNP